MRSPKLVFLMLNLFVFLTAGAQYKSMVMMGTGVSFLRGDVGIGVNSELVFPINQYFHYGIDLIFTGASDKQLNTTKIGGFTNNAVFAGDINLYFKPTVFKNFNFVVQSGCGYRHLNDN